MMQTNVKQRSSTSELKYVVSNQWLPKSISVSQEACAFSKFEGKNTTSIAEISDNLFGFRAICSSPTHDQT